MGIGIIKLMYNLELKLNYFKFLVDLVCDSILFKLNISYL